MPFLYISKLQINTKGDLLLAVNIFYT